MATRIGDTTLTFGVQDTDHGYYGSVKLSHAPTLVEAQRGDGSVCAADFTKDMKTCSGEYTYRTGFTDDPKTICGTNTPLTLPDLGIAVYIKSHDHQWTMGAFSKCSFTGVYYPTLGS